MQGEIQCCAWETGRQTTDRLRCIGCQEIERGVLLSELGTVWPRHPRIHDLRSESHGVPEAAQGYLAGVFLRLSTCPQITYATNLAPSCAERQLAACTCILSCRTSWDQWNSGDRFDWNNSDCGFRNRWWWGIVDRSHQQSHLPMDCLTEVVVGITPAVLREGTASKFYNAEDGRPTLGVGLSWRQSSSELWHPVGVGPISKGESLTLLYEGLGYLF